MNFDMNAFKQAQELAERLTKEMQAAQDQLVNSTSTGSSGDASAYVRVTMNGQYKAQKVEVSQELIKAILEGISVPEVRIKNMSTTLAGIIETAINNTVEEVTKAAQKQLGAIATAIQPNFIENKEEDKS